MSAPASEMRRLVVRDWMVTRGFEVDVRWFAAQFDGVDPFEVERALDRWAQLHPEVPSVAGVRDQLRQLRNNHAAGRAIAECRRVLAEAKGWQAMKETPR